MCASNIWSVAINENNRLIILTVDTINLSFVVADDFCSSLCFVGEAGFKTVFIDTITFWTSVAMLTEEGKPAGVTSGEMC